MPEGGLDVLTRLSRLKTLGVVQGRKLVRHSAEGHYIFFQFNPWADTWGKGIGWGHVRSWDLVH